MSGHTTLESLRAQGADRHDPVRYRYVELLSARIGQQPAAVQQVLTQRLQRAMAALAESTKGQPQASPPAGFGGVQHAAVRPSPLAQLNGELQARAQAEADQVRIDGGASASPMKSVRQFSEVWSRISAEQQVVQAIERGPENAGPLNPQKLILRSLSLMRGLSPDYLRRFLSQMDSLLWLDQANHRPRTPLRPGKARNKG